jgi:tetratricopeptide (TPR) repeat protein
MRRVQLALLLLLIGWPRLAAAEASGASPPSEEPRAASGEGGAAKQHFEAALEHYREGHYRSAIAELEAALNLDPASKDLLFNLALVHEKLGQLEQAISALERYAEIETDVRELDRARLWIQRMKGARDELSPPAVPARVPMPPPPPPTAAAVEPSSKRGWMIATASIAVVAATVGTIFGVRALAQRPGPNPSTSPGTSVEDLRSAQARAETSALVADVAFAIGIVSSTATAVLWFHEDSACPRPTVGKSPLGLTIRGAF